MVGAMAQGIIDRENMDDLTQFATILLSAVLFEQDIWCIGTEMEPKIIHVVACFVVFSKSCRSNMRVCRPNLVFCLLYST